jgi:hypothetical protein
MMRIAVVDISSGPAAPLSPTLEAAVLAVQRQILEHFAPVWEMTATLRVLRLSPSGRTRSSVEAELATTDGVVYVSRGKRVRLNKRAPGAVGYHFQRHRGMPCGFVFPDVAETTGDPWSVALSHEILEMIVDPDLNLVVGGRLPGARAKVILVPYEICDPVQTDTYEIDGVSVGNFVTPQYFSRTPRRPGRIQPTNHRNRPLKPFHVLPGGYYRYFDPEQGQWASYVAYKSSGYERWMNARERIGIAPRAIRREGRPANGPGMGWPSLGCGCSNFGDCFETPRK